MIPASFIGYVNTSVPSRDSFVMSVMSKPSRESYLNVMILISLSYQTHGTIYTIKSRTISTNHHNSKLSSKEKGKINLQSIIRIILELHGNLYFHLDYLLNSI